MKTVDKCRLCGSPDIPIVWDWGYSPLANAFKTKEDLNKPEFEAPLRYFKCNNCHSVQLKDEIDSEILFKDYNYESPPNLISHFKEMAKTTSELLKLNQGDFILDIGSNNGLLLEEYRNLGFRVMGFEPANNIALKAAAKNIRTINEFFNTKTAKPLKEMGFNSKLITCTNCFAHISDLDEFVNALKILMDNNSTFVFENAYLANTINNLDFGQAYFEHFYMHSIDPLKKFFLKHNMELYNIEFNNVQMGSIRGYVKLIDPKAENIDFFIVDEEELEKGETYEDFYGKILLKKNILKNILQKAKQENKSISIYGWPAKCTLMNKIFELEPYIDYIIEESNIKIGKYAPGTKLEVKSLDYFKQNPTDICILGAYNFEDDIKKKNEWYNGIWINPLKV